MRDIRADVCGIVALKYAPEVNVTGRERAMEWLKVHAADRAPVFLSADIPEDVLQVLRRTDLAIEIPGGVVVVRSPGDDKTRVVRALVWPIVERMAAGYAPAVIERDTAVRLYLGRTEPGPEIRIRQTGRTRWREEIAPGVVIRLERGGIEGTRTVEVGDVSLPVDAPEEVLLSLPIQFLREGGIQDVALWMKSLALSRSALVEAYRRRPRPVVLKRIEHIARDVGNHRLADMLGDVLNEEQQVRIGRDRTGVGRSLIVPTLLATLPTTHRPWLDRLKADFHRSIDEVSTVTDGLGSRMRSVDLGSLLESARSAKAYDAYHSSSIEGYRLSLDEVSILLGGGGEGGPTIEDVRTRLAVIGYGIAFDRLMSQVEGAGGAMGLTEALALDLYADLFTPSVEAGIVSPEDLSGWRRSPVFIRDTLFVPPGPEKVAPMLDLIFDELERLPREAGLLRATLVHLWFVWVHPFPDGNGRVARFLMNTALLAGGRPWLTIRVEQRGAYFEALRAAQLDGDYRTFARFIAESMGSEPK